MHLILNVESLVKPSGGIGRYTKQLLTGFLKHKQIDDVSCFVGHQWLNPKDILSELSAPVKSSSNKTISKQVNFKQKVKEFIRSLPFVFQAYTAYRSFLFTIKANKYKSSTYHEPNFILKPFKGVAITTIHDLSHIHFPQYHPKERVTYMDKNFNKTLASADHIITDSEFVKNELIEIMGVDKTRITAIPLGVDDSFYPRTKDELSPVLSNYDLKQGEYLLTLSTIEPRKNILQLLDVYMALDENTRKKYPLVLVGSDGWNNKEIKQKIRALEKTNDIKHVGYVSNDDLPYIVAGARSFIFIPFYEGFGLPPLEAMASGIPVLTSNVSSLPEIVGDAGFMVEPNDTQELINKLSIVLNDEEWREQSIAKGLERAKLFSWDECVSKTIDIYNNCQVVD